MNESIKLHISPQEALPGSYFGCTVDIGEQLMEAFIGAPGEFYVRVGTDAHPEGELRGQTFLPPDQPYLRIASHPELVIPGPGEPDARAFTLVIPTGVEDELCVYTDIEVLADPPTEIHIHEGGPEATGDVVSTLDPGPASGRSVHCNRGVNSDRLAEMFANPTSYYMDIHTASYPDGALRGNAIIDHATDEH